MASVYPKGDILYISWYDPATGKSKNKSLKMKSTKANRSKAEAFALEFQKAIDAEMEKLNRLGIKRVTLKEATVHFLKVNQNKDKTTVKGYEYFFNLLSSSISLDTPCIEFTKLAVEDWLLEMKKLNKSQNTLFSYQKILKKFLRFLFEYNYQAPFRINSDILLKQELKPVKVFETDDLQKIVNNLKFKSSNFRTFIYAFLYTGLRPTDLINLQVEDIDLKAGTMQYFEQKLKVFQIVPIHKELVPILKCRIDEVKKGKLFEYTEDKAISKAFLRYRKEIGIADKAYTLRTFRKTFISIAINTGMDVASVSKLVGHKKIDTTVRYYTLMSTKKKSEELNKFELPIDPTESRE